MKKHVLRWIKAASLGAFYNAQINRGRVERLPQEGFVGIGQHKAHAGQRALAPKGSFAG